MWVCATHRKNYESLPKGGTSFIFGKFAHRLIAMLLHIINLLYLPQRYVMCRKYNEDFDHFSHGILLFLEN